MNDLILWGRATLAWTPDGYKLSLEVALDTRASALFERRVADALRSIEAVSETEDVSYTWHGGYVTRTPSETRAEWGVLEITMSRTIFAVPTEELRRVLGALAAACRDEADEQQRRDEEIAQAWLKELRRG